MKDLLTSPKEFTGFKKPLYDAKYRLLQALLVEHGYEADRFSILEPACQPGIKDETECRKSELVNLYIDSLNANVDLDNYFDINTCGFVPITDVDILSDLAQIEGTITPIGTTGAQTINKHAGTVNIAVAGSSVVVTNNLVTTNSLVFAVIRTADATFNYIDSVVPGNGSFTITGNAAATGTVSIGFLVVNVI